jgi:hypothetical protein
VSILLYADDTIIFHEADMEKAVNIKSMLDIFEKLSRHKINCQNIKIFNDKENLYKLLFHCDANSFPFRYLEIPINYIRLLNKEWKQVKTASKNLIRSWKGKLSPYGVYIPYESCA